MSIKNLKPSVSQFQQGYFTPKNPEKYIGDLSKIIFRSSWELRFMKYCDNFTNILKWSSEPIPIPYYSSLDNKMHNYNVDFYIRYLMEDGQEKEYIIEIKPWRDRVEPKKPLRGQRYSDTLKLYREKKIKDRPIKESVKTMMTYNRDMKTYLINTAKFNAAKQFAEERGMTFKVLSEDFLFREKIKAG